MGVNHRNDGQIVFLREIEVSLVAVRYTHDDTGTVTHQNVIRQIDGDVFARGRVDGIAAGKGAGLLLNGRRSLDVALLLGLFDIGAAVLLFGAAGDELFHHRMFRRDDHKGGAEDSVHTGREHGHRSIGTLQLINDLRTFGTADPVALHGLDVFGPAGQRIETFQQAVGVIRDL